MISTATPHWGLVYLELSNLFCLQWFFYVGDDNEKTHVLTFLWNLLYILLYFNVLNAIMCADFIKKGSKNCCNVSLFILDAYEPIWCHPYTHTHTHKMSSIIIIIITCSVRRTLKMYFLINDLNKCTQLCKIITMYLICRINSNITLIQFYTHTLKSLGSVRLLMFLRDSLLLIKAVYVDRSIFLKSVCVCKTLLFNTFENICLQITSSLSWVFFLDGLVTFVINHKFKKIKIIITFIYTIFLS